MGETKVCIDRNVICALKVLSGNHVEFSLSCLREPIASLHFFLYRAKKNIHYTCNFRSKQPKIAY